VRNDNIRADSRMVHDMYLVQVSGRATKQSRYPPALPTPEEAQRSLEFKKNGDPRWIPVEVVLINQHGRKLSSAFWPSYL
jgi:hypothetical protein